MLKRVSELPALKTGVPNQESYVAKDVREFARNHTYDVAEISYEGKPAKNVAASCRMYIKKHHDQCEGVRVHLRGGKVFLEREVSR